MKLSLVVLLGLFACVLASSIPQQREPKLVKDKQFLKRQKQVIQLVNHIVQHSRLPEHIEIANEYKIEEHIHDYSRRDVVKDFLKIYENGMLQRREIFSVFYMPHLREAIALFRVLFYAKDYETFYKTAVWARQNMNEEMFLYSFSIAVIHRQDTKDVMLPPIYELYPHYFFPTKVIHDAQYYKQAQDEHKMVTEKEYKGYIIHSNYSGHYLNLHPEQSMSYYLEDIDLNAMYYYVHLHFPPWMSSEEFGYQIRERGTLFYHRLQQLLARYSLERLANGMGDINILDWNTPVETSYTPSLVYPIGLEFPSRPKFANLKEFFYTYGQKYTMNTYSYSYNLLQDYERRVLKTIDTGFALNTNGKLVEMEGQEGMNMLGNIIEGNNDTINIRFYGSVGPFARHLLGYSQLALNKHQLVPSALEHLETTLRDPVYYQFAMNILLYFQKYIINIPPYAKEELDFPGVEITNVEVDKLVTYMDEFSSSLTSAVFYGRDDIKDFNARVRQPRLNHKPFNYKLHVESDKDQKVIVKALLGPKYDEYGREVNLTDTRLKYVELDYVDYDIKAGENVIERNSHQFTGYSPDRTSIWKMNRQVQAALDDQEEFRVDARQNHGTWPQRLMLPKGSESGTVYQMLFYVYPFEAVEDVPDNTMNFNKPEAKPFGYPLDRFIRVDKLFEDLPNSHFHEVKIYFQDIYGVNYHQ